jgi:hypothetical protein
MARSLHKDGDNLLAPRPLFRRRGRLFVLSFLICNIALASSVFAANIFDDDWTPPPRKATSLPAERASTKPAPPIIGAPAAQLPVTRESVPQAVLGRRAVPDKADQARSRKLFREVFAKELADRSPIARRALAGRLLDEASKVATIPSDQFVLLFGATEAGRKGSDLNLCLRAADTLANAFEVDGLQVKTDAALKMSFKGDSSFTNSQNGWAGLALIDQLLGAEDYVAAVHLIAQLKPVTAADPSLATQLQNRAKEVDTRRTASERIARDLVKLKTAPEDPAANLAVGKFLCFIKGDWAGGLPLLAKGSDAKLKELARQELGKPSGAAAYTSLGDGWWDVAATQRDMSYAKVAQHAAQFYVLAMESTSGLRRALMEKRVAEAAGLAGQRVVNLMPLIDLGKDVVSGTWRLSNGQPTSGDGRFDRIRIPYEPPEEYDFIIEFTRQGSNDVVCQILSHSGHSFEWINGANRNTVSGFERIDGRGAGDGKTAVVLKATQDQGKRHRSVVKIRKHSIAAYVDGNLMVEYPTDFSDLTVHGEFNIGSDAIGIGSLGSTTFHTIEVIEVTGTGHQLPHRN